MKQELKAEEHIPIDIHTGKLLDWLISRRLCDRNWTNAIQSIRMKINTAIQDMPAVDEVTKLLSGSHINYFHCLRIIEILKDTEASSKNIFGYYSSQRMKDWQEIVNLYEKNDIYLAEAAQMLVRNVSYEVPSLRKQVTKCKQLEEECTRKESDYTRKISDFNEQYKSTCQKIGIKGGNIRKELLELLKDLPMIYDTTAKSCSGLENAAKFYKDFVEFTVRSKSNLNEKSLSVLSHIVNKGNTTVYEWKYGQSPLSVEEPNLQVEAAETNDEIDFGDEIDFSASVDPEAKQEDTDGSSGESNSWGIVEMPKSDDIDFGDDISIDNNAEIDFGIVSSSELGIILEESGTDGGVAKGKEALTLLDNEETRAAFMNDLLELECFLEQRKNEMNTEADMLSMNQFQNAPSTIQQQSLKNVESMLGKISAIVLQMSTEKVMQLCLIKSSPSYVDRLSETLSRKLQLADKAVKAKESSIEKRKAAVDEYNTLLPKIDLIVKKTKDLQKQIENDISKKYKNRPVNLMGGVNTL